MKKEIYLLLIEDNEGDLRIIQELLREQKTLEFHITHAGSLSDALRIMAKSSFDTILLDLGLPDSVGFDTFNEINKRYPFINSIIILTGLNDTELALKAVNKGAQDYIVKGKLDSDNLVKAIIYSIERSRLTFALKTQLDAKRIAEDALKSSREKLNYIAVQTSSVMYHISGKGLKFEYIHEAIENLTGYPVEEIAKDGFKNLIRKVERSGGRQMDLSKLDSIWGEKLKKEDSVDYLIETKNGELKWVNDKSYPVIESDGKINGYTGIFMDISSQKESEIEIIAQKNRSEQLFSNSPVGIVQLDSKGIILNANKSFERMFGYVKQDIIGENLDQLIVPENMKEEAKTLYSETIKGLAINELSIRKKKDGSIIYVSIAGVPIKIYKENAGFFVMFTDISKQKVTEEALIKTLEKAKESDRLKTAFLHNISHEIRTPMNAIVGFSALLLEPGQSDETKKSFLETIVQSSNNLLAIITDIVEISNIEAKLVKISKEEINLNDTFEKIYSIFELKLREKTSALTLKVNVAEKLIKISTDKTKFYQVLSNLLNNAIKFTDEGVIEFGYSLKNNYVEFFVTDTGIGIPEEQQSKIFDRFYQVEHSECRQYEGTGLGLAICKSYIELLGGNINVISTTGKGTSFRFTLPLENRNISVKKTTERVHAEDIIITKGKKILVAEDIESNFKLIKYFLSSLNIETIEAKNGKEALEYFRSNPDIDLILMDIKMPVMDGYTAIQHIRKINVDIPIIAQTAYADDKSHALDSGCNAFISKPFNKQQLLSVIKIFLI